MVFFKKVDVINLNHKLGGSQQGLYAVEFIKAGEKIWYCNCGDIDIPFTRQQLLDLIAKHPHLDYFVRSFSYMIDDDLYSMPASYMEQKNNDECALFNHSCDPNVGFAEDAFADNIIAIRDIQQGEELTCHYGFLETEASLIYGMECKCNSKHCDGKILFDYYRDQSFVAKYYNFMTHYIKRKAEEMKEKWYSRSCYVKRIGDDQVKDLELMEKGLFRFA